MCIKLGNLFGNCRFVRPPNAAKLTRKIWGSYWIIRKSFSKPFQKYLKQRKKWFQHIAKFRDTLAHCIPLYIMPFILSEANSKEYYRLEKEAFEAGLKPWSQFI